MIKEITMYTVICDNCGKDLCEGQEFSCWNDDLTAHELAMEDNWIKEEGCHYCPDCYDYDNNDSLVIDESIKKSISLPILELKNLLTDVHQLITGWNATEYEWTEWDQKVKESVIALQLKIDSKDNVLFTNQ